MAQAKRYSSVIAVVVILGIIYLSVSITRTHTHLRHVTEHIDSLWKAENMDSLIKSGKLDSLAKLIEKDSVVNPKSAGSN
jgi:hypothetical protein